MFFGRAAKKTLRQQAAEFVFDNSPDALYLRMNLKTVDCNKAYETLLGAPRERLLGLKPTDLAPEYQPCGMSSVAKTAEAVKAFEKTGLHRFEWMGKRLDGILLPVLVTLYAATLDGQPAMIVMWQDMRSIVDMRNAERLALQERSAALAGQTKVTSSLAKALADLSGGDLVQRLETPFSAEYEELRGDYNDAMAKLQKTMLGIAAETRNIGVGAGQIVRGADDLHRRTERQAASLKETSATLSVITETVKQVANDVAEATTITSKTRDSAESSGLVVQQAIDAMGQIKKSSDQIKSIIGVINELAFQTNLLALNAGVEAARAGESGRGFAVVASEVRALAQRSAEAAKEIEALISEATCHVEGGVNLVGQTGSTLKDIIAKVVTMSGLMAHISLAAKEQATSLAAVNTRIGKMEQDVQRNAVISQQSTASAHVLESDTQSLSNMLSRFRVAASA